MHDRGLWQQTRPSIKNKDYEIPSDLKLFYFKNFIEYEIHNFKRIRNDKPKINYP